MEECGRLRPRASEPLKQDVVVVAILVDVVAGVVDDDYDDHDDMMIPWESVAGSVPRLLSL